jgi:hypothetical protein
LEVGHAPADWIHPGLDRQRKPTGDYGSAAEQNPTAREERGRNATSGRVQVNLDQMLKLWHLDDEEMVMWGPGEAPMHFTNAFASESEKLLEGVARAGSWALWNGIFNKSWMVLLRTLGLNHDASMKLTRDVASVITKYRVQLHSARFNPEKAAREAAQAARLEAHNTYIRQWHLNHAHSPCEFSLIEMISWRLKKKEKWIAQKKSKISRAKRQKAMYNSIRFSTATHNRIQRTNESLRRIYAREHYQQSLLSAHSFTGNSSTNDSPTSIAPARPNNIDLVGEPREAAERINKRMRIREEDDDSGDDTIATIVEDKPLLCASQHVQCSGRRCE